MIDRLEKEVDMLERHLQVLRMVIENEPIGIVKMSNETGYPHHKVRYSLRVLEEENLIEPSSQGAITTEDTAEFVSDLDSKIDEIIEKLEGMKIDEVPKSRADGSHPSRSWNRADSSCPVSSGLQAKQAECLGVVRKSKISVIGEGRSPSDHANGLRP